LTSFRTLARLVVALSMCTLVVACGSSPSEDESAPTTAGTTADAGDETGGGDGVDPDAPCPVEAVPVVVSVDQWADVVAGVGGSCVQVTTIVSGAVGDPHHFEPSPADMAAFSEAKLVVVNGLGYDTWASTAASRLSPAPVLVEAAAAGCAGADDNAHRWYDPDDVSVTAAAVTTELRRLLPGAETYLDERATAWQRELARWTDLVAEVRDRHEGRPYAATESVDAPLAEVLGLVDVTPAGYARTDTHEGDPTPADIAAFRTVLQDGEADVLIYNTQTEGALPGQLRQVAEDAGIPVVEVTETVAADQGSFISWQVDQLRRLDQALAGSS
jgi:zinc/manganese transport system substrate-binding protein